MKLSLKLDCEVDVDTSKLGAYDLSYIVGSPTDHSVLTTCSLLTMPFEN